MFYELLVKLYQQLSSCLRSFPYCISTDLHNSLKAVISRNDTHGLDYIITVKLITEENNKIFKEVAENLLLICYYRSTFIFAEKLIKAGAKFRGDYVLYNTLSLNSSAIQQHLKVIEPNVTEKELIRANKIITAMESPITKYNQLRLDYIKIWLSVTYTDNQSYASNFTKIYKDFANNSDLIVKSIINLVASANPPEPDVKIIAPILDGIYSAFHHYALSLVYSPLLNFDQLELATLCHEVGHYIIYNRFENQGYPFKNNNLSQMQEYDIAATKTLCKVSELVRFKCNDNVVKRGLKSHEVAYDMLHRSIITIFNCIITIFNYQGMLNDDDVSIDLKSKILKTINLKFNINASTPEDVNIATQNIIKSLNLTKNLVILLERMGEYVARGEESDYSSELIVRLPELIVRELDNSTLSYLDPLKTFWLDNIMNLNTTIVELVGDSSKEEL